MSSTNGNGLLLKGIGAAYVRVSDDRQDMDRQYSAIRQFETDHKAAIRKDHWYDADEGWARDEADQRPDFQRLLRAVESGKVQWVVVDRLDRFGTKSAKQLMHFLYRLEEADCKLFDASGKEWTGEDDATEIMALIQGKTSAKEQRSLSYRVSGGKVEKARRGEYQGGPIPVGFDVGCYHRETDKELWRVVFDGFQKRLKVFPDGTTERFDGKGNFPKFQELTEVLRVTPSRDKNKVTSAVNVFKRFATESISTTALAHYLNDRGCRTCQGGYFQSHHVERMLADRIYLGYYTYNKRHCAKFHRFRDGRPVLEINLDKKLTTNAKADWVQSRRLFDPLVSRKVWDAVQNKLDQPKRINAPRSAVLYLAGLVHCGNCGSRMVAGPTRKPRSKARKDGTTGERPEFFCGTYAHFVRTGQLRKGGKCKCARNGVFQYEIEKYVERWLEESGRRLEILTEGIESDPNTERLEKQEAGSWVGFALGMERLKIYLHRHHPAEYSAIVRDSQQEDATDFEFIDQCIRCYRERFDPSAITPEIERLDAEHTALVNRWGDLPTPLAKDKAKERLTQLEKQIQEFKRQQEDVGESVANHYAEMTDLQDAIEKAKAAMRKEADEVSLRQRALALRGIIQRIECTFISTGQRGGGWGKKNSRLARVTIYPVVGESAEFPVNSGDSKGTLMYSSAHSRMKRTRVGPIR